jgi:hypothetical protein
MYGERRRVVPERLELSSGIPLGSADQFVSDAGHSSESSADRAAEQDSHLPFEREVQRTLHCS